MRVVDLGGTVGFWENLDIRPAELVLLNPIAPPAAGDAPAGVTVLQGDACDPPQELLRQHFDLVYSNSTIEHVGGHARRHQFANVVRALADSAWIQTPYRYFPIEPHFAFPLLQHLPARARVSILRHWPLVPPGFPQDRKIITQEVLDIELLSVTELQHYFPEASIEHERFAGLVKSLIAVIAGSR